MSSEALSDSVKDLLFGSISGAVGKVIEHPFDTVKVRMQSQPHTLPLKYKNSWDCIRQTAQKQGITGFYRGLSSPIVGAAAETSALFFSYNLAQSVIRSSLGTTEDLSFGWLLACGGISGLITSFVLTPIELVKCRMQVVELYHLKSTIGPLKMAKEIIQREGIKGLWLGQGSTTIRECGGSAAWFGCNELSKYYMKRWRLGREVTSKDKNTVIESLVAGACAGIGYASSLFPVDTIKSKIQTQHIVNPNCNINFISATKEIYKNGGVAGFYRGLGITMIRAIPSNAVIFFTYEKLKQHFN